mmetsp:Transcript_18427/g.40424  ORF Transcript_18427/g.40424 Transcript_18427/m.40424 type:complete len:261 (+) Transcript_18427:737-1519(+)
MPARRKPLYTATLEDLHGQRPVVDPTISHLSKLVCAPGPDVALLGQCQTVAIACGHGADALTEGNLCGLEAGGTGAISELTVVVLPPAEDLPILGEGETVAIAGGHAHGTGTGAAKVDALRRRLRCLRHVAVAELATVVAAPSEDLATLRNGEAVTPARRYGDNLAASSEVNLHRRQAPVDGAVTQLPDLVETPGEHLSLLGEGQAVIPASGDGAHRARQHQSGRQLSVRRVVPELAELIGTPAQDLALHVHGQAVPPPG